MRLRVPHLVLAAAALLGAVTTAGAEVLELRTGELVAGKVASVDDEGVTFLPEKGGSMRVAWDRVPATCRYELTRGTLAAGDAAGRVKLAKWCLEAGLHRSARRELLEAKGLGAPEGVDVDALLADVRRDEADAALEAVDALVERGELDPALERLKGFLRAADPGPDADRVRARVAEVVQRIERRDEELRQAEEERRKAEKEGRLKDWVAKTLKAADAKKEEGAASAAEGFVHLAKGNQTRAREALAAAEKKYLGARGDYLRVRKALKEGEVAEECAERARDCDDRAVEVLVRWGRLEVQNKNWKQASAIVDRGLKVDPVDRELLELRATIDANWIRRKLSDVSNARGTSSSN
jgi:tetratricopeptide (TPR) repeat protein